MNITVAVLVVLSALFATGLFTVYIGWHRWFSNIFTRFMAYQSFSFALILDYVAYNELAAVFHWPSAREYIVVALAVWAIIASVKIFGFYTFTRETIRQRRGMK